MTVWLVRYDDPEMEMTNEIESAWDTFAKAKTRLKHLREEEPNLILWLSEIKIFS